MIKNVFITIYYKEYNLSDSYDKIYKYNVRLTYVSKYVNIFFEKKKKKLKGNTYI